MYYMGLFMHAFKVNSPQVTMTYHNEGFIAHFPNSLNSLMHLG